MWLIILTFVRWVDGNLEPLYNFPQGPTATLWAALGFSPSPFPSESSGTPVCCCPSTAESLRLVHGGGSKPEVGQMQPSNLCKTTSQECSLSQMYHKVGGQQLFISSQPSPVDKFCWSQLQPLPCVTTGRQTGAEEPSTAPSAVTCWPLQALWKNMFKAKIIMTAMGNSLRVHFNISTSWSPW